jgi:hypothetical protein
MGKNKGASDQTRCPYCQCFFDSDEIEQHKRGCHDRPFGR